MLVSKKIQVVRSSMHLDEKKFGLHFRQSAKTIHDWENGYIIPTRKDHKNISRYTRISIDTYFDNNKSITIEDGKLIVIDEPNGSNNDIEIETDVVLEDYPHEDNARYEERD